MRSRGSGVGAADSRCRAARIAAWYPRRCWAGRPLGQRAPEAGSAEFLLGLVVEIFLGLARIEARLVRLLRERLRNSRERSVPTAPAR